MLDKQGPLAVPRGVEPDKENKALTEIVSHQPSTDFQDVTSQSVLPQPVEQDAKRLSILRRKWYAGLQFPKNQWDFSPEMSGRLHSLYLVTCGPFAKIGIAWNPSKRFGGLLSSAPVDMCLEVAYWVPYPTSRLAEAYCHAALHQFWVRGEWFEVDAKIAKRVIDAIAWQACKSRGAFLKKAEFANETWPVSERPGTARLLKSVKGYQKPPPFLR